MCAKALGWETCVGGDWSGEEKGENVGGEVRESGRVGNRSGTAFGEQGAWVVSSGRQEPWENLEQERDKGALLPSAGHRAHPRHM